MAILVEVTETEIDKFDVIIVVEEKILGLQVSMDNAKFVDILNAREDLSVHLARLGLFQPSILDNVLEELAARTVFHDQVQVVIVFNHIIELNDVWMPDFLENCDLTVDSFQVCMVLYLLFLEYFDRHLFVSGIMCTLLNLAEGALSLGLAHCEVSNLLVLFFLFFCSGLLRFICNFFFRAISGCSFGFGSGSSRITWNN